MVYAKPKQHVETFDINKLRSPNQKQPHSTAVGEAGGTPRTQRGLRTPVPSLLREAPRRQEKTF